MTDRPDPHARDAPTFADLFCGCGGLSPAFGLWLPGEPVPWARPRIGRHGGMFNTPRSQQYRERLQWAAMEAKLAKGLAAGGPVFPRGEAVSVTISFRFGKDQPGVHIEVMSLAGLRQFRAVRPDLSNLTKLVEDSLTGIIFADDAQIVQINAAKVER